MHKNEISKELRSLSNRIHRYMENKSHKKCIDTITGTNGWIIGYLSENRDHDIYQRDLENEFGVTRSTASKVIDLMVKKGLVQKQAVPHDARLKKLELTLKSLELADIMAKDRDALEAALTKGFSEEELLNLSSYIQKMKNNLKQ